MPARSASTAALGRAIHTLRAQCGINQEEAARRSNVARAYYGRIERGEADPTYETMIKLADGLATSPYDLIVLAERFRSEPQDPPA
jgi:transcriptional regulator with XRE-family HTH domain